MKTLPTIDLIKVVLQSIVMVMGALGVVVNQFSGKSLPWSIAIVGVVVVLLIVLNEFRKSKVQDISDDKPDPIGLMPMVKSAPAPRIPRASGAPALLPPVRRESKGAWVIGVSSTVTPDA